VLAVCRCEGGLEDGCVDENVGKLMWEDGNKKGKLSFPLSKQAIIIIIIFLIIIIVFFIIFLIIISFYFYCDPCYLLFYCTDVSFTATRDNALTVPDACSYRKQRLRETRAFPFFKSVTNGYIHCAHW
jgi:hypothetical protein